MKTTIKENVYLGALIISCLLLSATWFNAFKSDNIVVAQPEIRVSYDPAPTRHYTKAGTASAVLLTRVVNKYYIKLTPTSATGNIDISALGLTTIIGKQISAQRNTTNAGDSPQISFQTTSTSSLSYNITQANAATVTILGSVVTLGAPLIAAPNLSGVEVNIELTGY